LNIFNALGGGERSQVEFFVVAGAEYERLSTPFDKLARLDELCKSSWNRELDDNVDDERRAIR
jgi:hypothetical protein